MALSRLRHPVISRAPSLLIRARLFSSRSLSRPSSLSMLTGVHDNSLKLKLWVGGIKHFSSTDPSHAGEDFL